MGGSDSEPAGEYKFFCGNRNDNHELGTSFFVQKGIISAVKGFEIVNFRMSYMIIRCHGCHAIVLTANGPSENKIDYVKGSSYEKLECAFDQFGK
jgi:hypothetical protein